MHVWTLAYFEERHLVRSLICNRSVKKEAGEAGIQIGPKKLSTQDFDTDTHVLSVFGKAPSGSYVIGSDKLGRGSYSVKKSQKLSKK